MGFEGLLGNDRLKQNLTSSISRGHISHFYLICGPQGAGKRTLARLLAAAAVCKAADKPCLSCAACRKVMAGTHPDFITVDDPEKKHISVDLIRQTRADMYIQPNEADRKIYLFPRAHDMAEPSQNALLKILEEPPAYGVFILLTNNPQKLLPTVRSRCTELALTGLPDSLLRKQLSARFPEASQEMLTAAISRSGGFLGQAIALLESGTDLPPQTQSFLESYAARDAFGLVQTLVPMEKYKRDALIETLTQWVNCLEGALLYRSGVAAATPMAQALSTGRSGQELLSAIEALQTSIEYAQGNVSPAAICGHLAWALR